MSTRPGKRSRGGEWTAFACAAGGARGILALGAVSELCRRRYLNVDAVRFCSGTSIGAVVAAGIALGRSPRTMLRAAQRHPLQPDVTPANFGLDSGNGLRRWLCAVLGIGEDLTFKNAFRATGKTLCICVTNLNKRAPEYWSHQTHPDMPIVDALRVSCSIPGVFSGVRFGDALYVDGALTDPFPTTVCESAAPVLGLCFDDRRGQVPRPITSLPEFLAAVAACHKFRPPAQSASRLVLNTARVDPLELVMPAPKMHALYRRGARQAAAFVKKHQ